MLNYFVYLFIKLIVSLPTHRFAPWTRDVCMFLFLFSSAENSAWQLLGVQCPFVKETDFQREHLFDTHLPKPLMCIIPCTFPHHPWGRHCRDRVWTGGSTAGQPGWNPCPIANQRWAQGQQSSVFPKSHDPLSKKSREIVQLLFTTTGCMLSGPARSNQVNTGRSVLPTALNLGFKFRLI